MPALRVDWESIKAALVDPGAAYVFILPDAARQLFLAIADQLSWEATYRAYGYDYADWDALQALHSAGVAGLLGGIPLDELLTRLDTIIDLLGTSNDGLLCCDGVGFEPIGGDENTGGGDDIEDGQGDPPETWGDDPILDWADWEAYKCGAAWEFALLPAELMRRFDAISQHEGAAGWADMIASALSVIPLIGQPAAVLWAFIAGILDGVLDWVIDFEGAAQEIEAAQEDIQCAIYQADGAQAAAVAMKAAVLDAITGTAANTLASFFPYEMWATIVYTGRFENTEGAIVNLDDVITPRTDCCDCPNFTIVKGGLNSETNNSISIDSLDQGDREIVELRLNWDGSSYCGSMREVASISFSTGGPVNRVRAWDQDNVGVFDTGLSGSCNVTGSGIVGVEVARIEVTSLDSVCGGTNSFDVDFTFAA